MSKVPIACDKHLHNPLKGYSPCAGCEVERLAIERDEARSELAALKAQMAEQAPVAWMHSRTGAVATDLTKRTMEEGAVPSGYDVPLYAAPPAAQDVSGLIEALEWCEDWFSKHCPTSKVDGFLPIVHPMLKSIRNALAAHRQAQQQAG